MPQLLSRAIGYTRKNSMHRAESLGPLIRVCQSTRVYTPALLFRVVEDEMTQSNYSPSLQGNPMSATGSQYPNGNPNSTYNPAGAKNTDSYVPLHPTGEDAHNDTCDGPAPRHNHFPLP